MSLVPQKLFDLAGKVLDANRDAGRRIVTAESCTGGIVAAALTEHAGSSDVVQAGFVTYANQAKSQMLLIPEAMIVAQGAVSENIALAMAKGALDKVKTADVAVAITGIAGPGGGTFDKPVGTVWIAKALRRGDVAEAHLHQFDKNGSREEIRLQAASAALELLLP
ncbi:CinA family protein [Sphingomicrobium clamense]|uniref:CinA family protein n=1 Tax=Sphingomicrobium clamense TaxID=2851013 RepID=A0ABS6V6D4_9SPHN|nr:CinA family protein [Sphingomicrobium sp. B8]MBW0145122.1 CinA family protein [Sphingomicrobium sp. B8]